MEPTAQKQKKKFFRRLLKRYRLVVLNETTFEERWSLRLTPMNIFIWAGSGALLIITGTVLIIAWTPLREFIPGYPDGSERQDWIASYERIDSLESKLAQNDAYLERIQKLLRGETIADSVSHQAAEVKPENVKFEESEVEKDFKEKMADKVKYSFNAGSAETGTTAPVVSAGPEVFFFVPAQGDISQSFSLGKNHFGVDIATLEDDPVHAVQEGTVVFAGWTVDGGHEIHIQHSGNLVTVYKHNSYLLKKTGDRLRPGDVIAFAGSSGRLSEGTHLHFEIWHNGVPVDPEKYVVF